MVSKGLVGYSPPHSERHNSEKSNAYASLLTMHWFVLYNVHGRCWEYKRISLTQELHAMRTDSAIAG